MDTFGWQPMFSRGLETQHEGTLIPEYISVNHKTETAPARDSEPGMGRVGVTSTQAGLVLLAEEQLLPKAKTSD